MGYIEPLPARRLYAVSIDGGALTINFGGDQSGHTIDIFIQPNTATVTVDDTPQTFNVPVHRLFLVGGEGKDTIALQTARAVAATINLNGGDDSLGGINDRNAVISVFAGDGDDFVNISGQSRDTIYGGDGNDTIDGGKGADSILGGPGNDIIKGHGGNDTLIGGAGNDSVSV
jgi:Ca2+-binding RTX toxin-like protein